MTNGNNCGWSASISMLWPCSSSGWDYCGTLVILCSKWTTSSVDHLHLEADKPDGAQMEDIQLEHQKMFVNRKQGCMSRTSVGGPSPPLHLVLGRGLMHPWINPQCINLQIHHNDMMKLDGALKITSLYEINFSTSNLYLILAEFWSPKHGLINQWSIFYSMKNLESSTLSSKDYNLRIEIT